MSSSKLHSIVIFLPKWVLVLGSLLLAACAISPTPAENASSETGLADCTVINESASPQDAAMVQAFRRSVENGPFYRLPVTDSGLKTCQVHYDAAEVVLEYQFRDDSWLKVKRDVRIEFTEQEVHFDSPPPENPVTILAEVEQLTFGAEGCGMDWGQSETQPLQNKPGITEVIYRGDVCNCQARIRRDSAGIVVGLLLRSAC